MTDHRLYAIALTLTPGLGPQTCRQLLELYPSPEEIFSLGRSRLQELFGRHTAIIDSIEAKTCLPRAQQELDYIDHHGIDMLFIGDDDYPQRLKRAECGDLPVVLYRKGRCNLNAQHAVSIVGTRRATEYGKECTRRIIEQMQADGITIVSGLAYGIDTAAHTCAVNYGLPTIGVVGHGLETLYPAQNRTLAQRMVEQGGAVLTEFISGTKIAPGNFPARNRIIAALSDATIVVEASEKGGALITATLANGYNRDVFALPGRIDDPYSKGCNNIIATNKASMLRSADDLYYMMGWKRSNTVTQQTLFPELSSEEQIICHLLETHREMTLDDMQLNCTLSLPKIATILLNLELKNIIKCLPGKIYKLI